MENKQSISSYNKNEIDNIDKFILKLVHYETELPTHTIERIEETINSIFVKNK